MPSRVFKALHRHPALARPRRQPATKAASTIPPLPLSKSPAEPAPPRVAPSRTPRFLTLSARRWRRATDAEAVVPYLRMSGRWLAEHGFPVGGNVHVTVEQGRVVLTTDATSAAGTSKAVHRVAGCSATAIMRDFISYLRSPNARPFNRLPRERGMRPPADRLPLFTSRSASALLLLELAAHEKVPAAIDAEWFEGEFLSRVRAYVFEEPAVTAEFKDRFDSYANLYCYEIIDAITVPVVSRRRYHAIILRALRTIFQEERIGDTVTPAASRVFGLGDYFKFLQFVSPR